MKTGIELIAEERREQIEKHGFSTFEQEFHWNGELKDAAMYALTLERQYYPESWEFWWHDKMKAKQERLSEHDFCIEQLKIAGALIAAEIDRMNHEEPI